MLLAKGDADDGDAEDHAEGGMLDCQRQAGGCDPDDVQQQRNRAAFQNDLLAEGREGERRELEALQADGNADDSNAPQKSEQRPGKPGDQSAEEKPDDVAKTAQIITSNYVFSERLPKVRQLLSSIIPFFVTNYYIISLNFVIKYS